MACGNDNDLGATPMVRRVSDAGTEALMRAQGDQLLCMATHQPVLNRSAPNGVFSSHGKRQLVLRNELATIKRRAHSLLPLNGSIMHALSDRPDTDLSVVLIRVIGQQLEQLEYVDQPLKADLEALADQFGWLGRTTRRGRYEAMRADGVGRTLSAACVVIHLLQRLNQVALECLLLERDTHQDIAAREARYQQLIEDALRKIEETASLDIARYSAPLPRALSYDFGWYESLRDRLRTLKSAPSACD